VDISFTVFCLFVCLLACTVTDFSGEDKASGVKFCMVVQGRPGQKIAHFGEICFPVSLKSDESASHRELDFHVEKHHKRQTSDAPFVEYGAVWRHRSVCVDIGQSPLTYLLVFTLATCSGKRSLASLSVCLSVPSAYSPWITRGQHATFRPDSREDRRTCCSSTQADWMLYLCEL